MIAAGHSRGTAATDTSAEHSSIPGPQVRRWHWGDASGPLVTLLARGGVLAIPTESSYGLAVSPRSQIGADAVYRIKGRPATKALLVIAACIDDLTTLGIDEQSPIIRFAQRFWPAPLTVLSPRHKASPPLPATGGQPSLAVRIPAHHRLRSLLATLGPVTATSANRAGRAPILVPAALDSLLLGHDAMIIDDGPLDGGLPSTLLRHGDDGFEVVRAGALDLTAEDVAQQPREQQPREQQPREPGAAPSR